VLFGVSSRTWETFQGADLNWLSLHTNSMAEDFVSLSRTIQNSGRFRGGVSWLCWEIYRKYGREGSEDGINLGVPWRRDVKGTCIFRLIFSYRSRDLRRGGLVRISHTLVKCLYY
jgi:hypothetical protein